MRSHLALYLPFPSLPSVSALLTIHSLRAGSPPTTSPVRAPVPALKTSLAPSRRRRCPRSSEEA